MERAATLGADRLSALPDDVLLHVMSFLRTDECVAASVLSSRFRHLWPAVPCLHLVQEGRPGDDFASFVDTALERHDPSASLRTLRIDSDDVPVADRWISRARSLHVRHLDLALFSRHQSLQSFLPAVDGIHTLESLSLRCFSDATKAAPTLPILPSTFQLANLKSLCLRNVPLGDSDLERLVSCCQVLDDLRLSPCPFTVTRLRARNVVIKRLYLTDPCGVHGRGEVRLSCPGLECLLLESSGLLWFYQAELPALRSASIKLDDLFLGLMSIHGHVMRSVTKATLLKIVLAQHVAQRTPFCVFHEQGGILPTYPNLERLDVSMCAHEQNLSSLVTFIKNCSPKLESIHITHLTTRPLMRQRSISWASKLPRNSSGSVRSASFANLQNEEVRKKVVKQLSKKLKIRN